MNFLRSRAEQLADYLRGCIVRGEIGEPLPGTRAWSQQLGVGRRTMDGAVRILRREGLIQIEVGRGLRLTPPTSAMKLTGRPASRRIRLIHYGHEFPDDDHWVPGVSERLSRHGVEVSYEKCTAARLKAFARSPPSRRELLMLSSLPPKFQSLFNQRPGVLLLGEPAAGVRCPFVSDDLEGAFRHATLHLLRRGFQRLTLLLPRAGSPGLESGKNAFQKACTEWPRLPAPRCDIVTFPMGWPAMLAAAQRYAETVEDRRGIVVQENIPVGLIMTALMARGVAIPRQVELVTFVRSVQSLKVVPRPASYVYSQEALVQTLTRVALDYFKTGIVPPLAKRLPLAIGPRVD